VCVCVCVRVSRVCVSYTSVFETIQKSICIDCLRPLERTQKSCEINEITASLASPNLGLKNASKTICIF